MKCAKCVCCLCLYLLSLSAVRLVSLSLSLCVFFWGTLQVCFDNACRIMGPAQMLRHEMSWSRGDAPATAMLLFGHVVVAERRGGQSWAVPRLMSLAKSQIAVHELFMFMQMSPLHHWWLRLLVVVVIEQETRHSRSTSSRLRGVAKYT